MATIRVVSKRPGLPATVVTIENTYEGMKVLLDGGTYCGIWLNGEIAGYCDDDGLSKGLPPNVAINGQTIVGPIVFSKSNRKGEDVGYKTLEAALTVCRFLDDAAVK